MKSLDRVNTDRGNTLYLVFNNEDGYIEKINENKYLIVPSTKKDNEI